MRFTGFPETCACLCMCACTARLGVAALSSQWNSQLSPQPCRSPLQHPTRGRPPTALYGCSIPATWCALASTLTVGGGGVTETSVTCEDSSAHRQAHQQGTNSRSDAEAHLQPTSTEKSPNGKSAGDGNRRSAQRRPWWRGRDGKQWAHTTGTLSVSLSRGRGMGGGDPAWLIQRGPVGTTRQSPEARAPGAAEHSEGLRQSHEQGPRWRGLQFSLHPGTHSQPQRVRSGPGGASEGVRGPWASPPASFQVSAGTEPRDRQTRL